MADPSPDAVKIADRIMWQIAPGIPETLGPLRDAIARAIDAARREEIEECAKVAQHDQIRECPYATDKKGDPTWNHTDKDICPICKVPGEDSFRACVGIARNRIAASIRSRLSPPAIASEKETG